MRRANVVKATESSLSMSCDCVCVCRQLLLDRERAARLSADQELKVFQEMLSGITNADGVGICTKCGRIDRLITQARYIGVRRSPDCPNCAAMREDLKTMTKLHHGTITELRKAKARIGQLKLKLHPVSR